jgi:hypothetical protein
LSRTAGSGRLCQVWGKFAVLAAGSVSLNAIRGKYNDKGDFAETMEAVTLDFLVSYLTQVGADAFIKKAGPAIAKNMTKLAQWFANKGLDSKVIKQLTGKWASNKNVGTAKGALLEGEIANHIDDVLGDGTVQKYAFELKNMLGVVRTELDIVTKKFIVEVKSGKPELAKAMEQAKVAAEKGLGYVLYAPEIAEQAAKKFEQEIPGIIIVKTKEALIKAIK